MNTMKLSMLLLFAFAGGMEIPSSSPAAAPPTNQAPATSEIRRESTGLWLYLDGKRTPAFGGAVYQHTEDNKHIREYSNSLHTVYQALNDEDAGGLGHGTRLAHMSVSVIRTFQLPVDNEEDINATKEIFRQLYEKHGIKVLIGDWAGLHSGMDYSNPADLAALRSHVQKLVVTYSHEPWVFGWQLGNENNYDVNDGILGHEIGLEKTNYYALMDGLAGLMKQRLRKDRLLQFVSLGNGDLTTNEAQMIGSLKNIDAVGINCYREDPNGFEELITTAAAQLHRSIYFAEIGMPAADQNSEQKQAQYLQQVFAIVFSHAASRARSGTVLGAFVHETTDEPWKRYERGREADAHFGILGKPAETAIGQLLKQNHDFSAWVLPTNDTPETLLASAWHCLNGPYADSYSRDYGYAMAYANRAITLYQDAARAQQQQLINEKAPLEKAADPKYWALNTVGTGYFIIGDCMMLLSYDFKGAQKPSNQWQRLAELADVSQTTGVLPKTTAGIIPTNGPNCMRYAQEIFRALAADFPYAHLQQRDGSFLRLDRVTKARFPELSPPYIPFAWQNGAIFTAACLVLTLGFAGLFRRGAARANSIPTVPAMSVSMRVLLFLALTFNFASLFWFVNWWFHPVRAKYYTVNPWLFGLLSGIGAIGVIFYLCVWQPPVESAPSCPDETVARPPRRHCDHARGQ